MFIVISMPDELERRKYIDRQFKKYNIDYEFFNAYTPECIDLEQYPDNLSLTVGEKCCALGHLAAMQQFLDTSAEFLVILEDDVLFLSNPKVDIKNIKKIIKKCDILILGYSKVPYKLRYWIQFFRPLKIIHHLKGIDYCYPYKQWKCGGVCYAMSRSGARKAIELSRSSMHVADDWPKWETLGLNILHRKPLLAIENYEEFDSSLEPERRTYKSRTILLRFFAGVLRHFYLLKFSLIKK